MCGLLLSSQSSVGLMSFLPAMVAGPVAVLVLAAVVAVFGPEPVLGNGEQPRGVRPATGGFTPGQSPSPGSHRYGGP